MKEQASTRRRFEGVVTSTKMKGTAVVSVSRRLLHPKYKKYFTQSKKYHIDDPGNDAKVGARVMFEETRPISKTKRWRLIKK